MEIQKKPYGMLYTQGKSYYLLQPQPISRDSWQQDGTYGFYVGANDPRGKVVGIHLFTNQFAMEMIPNMPNITLSVDVEEKEESSWDYNSVEWDVLTTNEMEENGFNDPVMDDILDPILPADEDFFEEE